MDDKSLMNLLGRAFAHGEIDAVAPHMADNCTYLSEYSGKEFFCAEDIICDMRDVASNVDDTCRYTYKLIALGTISEQSSENNENMRSCPWGILLYQFDDSIPAALVVTKLDLAGKLCSIVLSRDTDKYELSFDGYAGEDDSPLDLPNTVTPMTINDRQRREMQQAFSGQKRNYDVQEDSIYYIWRKADEFIKSWLKENGYTVLESEIFRDCIGYRCNRNGYAYTVFMYAYGQKKTSQLDGDFCSKLADLPFASKSTVLIVYLNVKKFRKDNQYNYRVFNYCGNDSAPELWRLNHVNGKFILEYYPRKEMMDATIQLMYAFNRDCGDAYECIITETSPSFSGLEYPGSFMNAGFFNSLSSLHKKYGNMKIGFVRYNDVIFSSVPYLEDYGFFGFRCDNATNRILEVTAYAFDGGEREIKEFIKTDLEEPGDLYDFVPKLVDAVPLPPAETERFAVKLYWENGETRKYVLPIDREAEHDEVVSYQGYVFTDKIWASVRITEDRVSPYHRLKYGTAITFKNEMYISAMLCYQESTPFAEPKAAGQIVYNDGKHCLRKLWTWDIESVHEDEETGLLKSLVSGQAFNWYGRSTFATLDGKRCTSLDFDFIDNFHEGLARVAIVGYGYGFVDPDMNIVIPLIYENAEDFSEGRATVKQDGKWFFIDKNGRELPVKETAVNGPYQEVCEYSEGLCRVSTLKLSFMDLAYHSDYEEIAGTWGFVDEAGEVVVPPQYIYANDFEDGIAIVCKGKWTLDPKWDNEYNKGRYWTDIELWGGIDRNGNEVIPFVFDEIKHFSDTSEAYMAHVGGWPNGKWGVIDRSGHWLADPIFEDFGYDYMDGLITFYAESKWSGDDTLIGIYDLKAKSVLFEPQFQDVSFNSDGTFDIEVFDERLGHTVAKIIDRTGKELFPSEYSSIYSWREPLEVVIQDENGSRHGLVDRAGNVLLPCKYHTTWNGIYWEKKRLIFEENDKQGMMDFDENIIIPAIYHNICGVEDPLLTVRVGEKKNYLVGLLDHDGKVVFPAEYSRISWLKDKTYLVCCKNGTLAVYQYVPTV